MPFLQHVITSTSLAGIKQHWFVFVFLTAFNCLSIITFWRYGAFWQAFSDNLTEQRFYDLIIITVYKPITVIFVVDDDDLMQSNKLHCILECNNNFNIDYHAHNCNKCTVNVDCRVIETSETFGSRFLWSSCFLLGITLSLLLIPIALSLFPSSASVLSDCINFVLISCFTTVDCWWHSVFTILEYCATRWVWKILFFLKGG